MRIVSVGTWLLLSGCQLVFPLDETPRDAPADITIAECPASYRTVGAGRYRFASEPNDQVRWPNAAALCEGDQIANSSLFTHLVVFSSVSEIAMIIEEQALAPGTNTWVGLTDETVEDTFEWVTNEPMVPKFPAMNGAPPWELGEPNNNDDNEDCIAVTAGGTFNDVACTGLLPYVCECDGFPSR